MILKQQVFVAFLNVLIGWNLKVGIGGLGDMPQLNIYFMHHSQIFDHEVDGIDIL